MMREAIDLLRRTARFFRFGPGSNVDDRFVAHEHDRAADLIEALSNPPETVEELERRGQELTGVPLQAGRNEETGLVAAYWEIDGSSEYACGTSVRAAWFAIVGMMEANDVPEEASNFRAAADRIREMEAENARLREAVQKLLPHAYDIAWRDKLEGHDEDAQSCANDIKLARAALGEES